MKKWILSAAVAASAIVAGLGVTASADHHGEHGKVDLAKLDKVLAAQPESAQERYDERHPRETIEFFGIEPGMTVVDTLPGQVWYTGILMPYLGHEGKVIGMRYSVAQGEVAAGNSDGNARTLAWPASFKEQAKSWCAGDDCASLDAMLLGGVPESAYGTVDVVMMVRAMHHLNRFENRGNHRTKAFQDVYNLLKPGGIFGVVQHRAPEENSDEWATGDNGYVKQAELIKNIEAAGFELVATSEINANPKDKPSESDFVWRLPPRLAGSEEGTERRAQMEAIGESDRMTLKFRKPA